jgi:hypothetical protein
VVHRWGKWRSGSLSSKSKFIQIARNIHIRAQVYALPPLPRCCWEGSRRWRWMSQGGENQSITQCKTESKDAETMQGRQIHRVAGDVVPLPGQVCSSCHIPCRPSIFVPTPNLWLPFQMPCTWVRPDCVSLSHISEETYSIWTWFIGKSHLSLPSISPHRGASILEITHIYFLPGVNGLGNVRNVPKLQMSGGGGLPPDKLAWAWP